MVSLITHNWNTSRKNWNLDPEWKFSPDPEPTSQMYKCTLQDTQYLSTSQYRLLSNQLRPKGTCSKSHVWGILTSNSGYVSATCSGPQRLSVLHSQPARLQSRSDSLCSRGHSKKCVTVLVSMISVLHHPAGLQLQGSKGHRKELNLDCWFTSVPKNPNHIWEVELLLLKSEKQPETADWSDNYSPCFWAFKFKTETILLGVFRSDVLFQGVN